MLKVSGLRGSKFLVSGVVSGFRGFRFLVSASGFRVHIPGKPSCSSSTKPSSLSRQAPRNSRTGPRVSEFSGFGFRGFQVLGVGFRGFQVSGFGFRGFQVSDFGCRVSGFGSENRGGTEIRSVDRIICGHLVDGLGFIVQDPEC